MKDIRSFNNKKVLVLGLAKSGEAAARLLDRLGAIVTVNDGKPFEDNPAAQNLLEAGIKVICGSHPLDLLDENFELIVKNPGIPYTNDMIQKAQEKRIPIYTEIELAYLNSEAPIIAITGSNGKTTTTTMIADVFEQAGRSGLLSGNIGFPASEVAAHATATDTLIMELSSFQLMGIEQFHPKIAVITNFFEGHLDYHGTFEDYVSAKWRIQDNMTPVDYLVINHDQAMARELAQQTSATVVPISTTGLVDGAYLLDGQLYFREEAIMPAHLIGVPGSHNVENALATIAVAKLSGIENQAIIAALSQFGGVKHRLQKVATIAGVTFYNDSKSTNTLATQKALSGFDNHQLLLIAGGLDRGNDFDDLLPHVEGLKGMIVLGETAPKLIALCEKAGINYQEAKDVKEAVHLAFAKAQAGDVILLSPANASWDMYKNFEVRGDEFLAAVDQLQGDYHG
ncbi:MULTISPECIES: UDP-N-acetylmuramoyl-L-alanine--D-glutamate ligase [unclassified Streptococcus]|uniref:UDP-N-acetylmuramoyl-L-alanine--D-glutamate ligase n=1 Tax=unclassified Streptococcus TaxID=2608887 RepID=UPI00359D1CF4